MYDCRIRPWYTASATSPKNLLILQDVSGSMTGMRRKIAKAVVSTILDTLTENDYVNVFNFSEETTALVGCFNKSGVPTLVQVCTYWFHKSELDGSHKSIFIAYRPTWRTSGNSRLHWIKS